MTPEELYKKSNEIARKKFTRAGLLAIMKENEEREKEHDRTTED